MRHARQEPVVCLSMIDSGTADVAAMPMVGSLRPAPGTGFFGEFDPTPQNRQNDLAYGVDLADVFRVGIDHGVWFATLPERQ